MKKTFKVVMLPTENRGALTLRINKPELIINYSSPDNKFWINQHLYILSDDEIKEGDWYINSGGCLFQAKNYLSLNTDKKIVATTDKSIGYTDRRVSPVPNFCDYPQLNESFIQAFIKAYNDGKPITEVDLEMEDKGGYRQDSMNGCWISKWIIKTRPDNTVIVHQSKMYSRDELFELLKELRRECINAHNKGLNPEVVGIAQFVK